VDALVAACFHEMERSKPTKTGWSGMLMKAWGDAVAALEEAEGVAVNVSITAEEAADIMIHRYKARCGRLKLDVFARMRAHRQLYERFGAMTVEAREGCQEWHAQRLCLASTIMGPFTNSPTDYHKERVNKLLKKFAAKITPQQEAHDSGPNKFEQTIIKHIKERMKPFLPIADVGIEDRHQEELDAALEDA